MTVCIVINSNFSIKQTFTDMVLCWYIEEMYMLTYMHLFLPTCMQFWTWFMFAGYEDLAQATDFKSSYLNQSQNKVSSVTG